MKDYDKITRETYDSISEDWDLKREYYWKPVVDFAESFSDVSELKFLDLGCGGGRHMELALKKGFSKEKIFGCDFSKGQIETVKNKGFEGKVCDLRELDFDSGSFDVVVCIAAHHHLLKREEQVAWLKEMKRILSRRGKTLLSEWMPDSDFLDKQVVKGKFEFLDSDRKKVRVTYTDLSQGGKKFDRYYYLFGREEIIKMCKEAGFEVLGEKVYKGNLYLSLK